MAEWAIVRKIMTLTFFYCQNTAISNMPFEFLNKVSLILILFARTKGPSIKDVGKKGGW